jgi:hypothetical protein
MHRMTDDGIPIRDQTLAEFANDLTRGTIDGRFLIGPGGEEGFIMFARWGSLKRLWRELVVCSDVEGDVREQLAEMLRPRFGDQVSVCDNDKEADKVFARNWRRRGWCEEVIWLHPSPAVH